MWCETKVLETAITSRDPINGELHRQLRELHSLLPQSSRSRKSLSEKRIRCQITGFKNVTFSEFKRYSYSSEIYPGVINESRIIRREKAMRQFELLSLPRCATRTINNLLR